MKKSGINYMYQETICQVARVKYCTVSLSTKKTKFIKFFNITEGKSNPIFRVQLLSICNFVETCIWFFLRLFYII